MPPGPLSSPCNDRTIVVNAQKREILRLQGKLFSGKTQKKLNKHLHENKGSK